ncbi:MAG: general secretion pathway protein GspB [Pseudomonadota bacterium]
MSFILDSLRKSENARQQNVGPSISEIGTSSKNNSNRSMFTWLGILLGVNVIVLLVSLWRPWQDDSPPPAKSVNPTPVQTTMTSTQQRRTTPVTEQPALRGEVRPLSSEVPAASTSALTPQRTQTRELSTELTLPPETVEQAPILERPGEILPTIHELQADGSLQLANLHLDMHMYDADPKRRFVFLNSKKYKEGERISEGPLLEEIRNDAVVFYYKGQRFLLPR